MKGNEYNKRFEKIDKLLYVLIVLVSISLLIGIINMAGGSNSTTTNTNTNTTGEETSGEYDVSMFDSVDLAGLKTAIDNPLGSTVVYIGRSTCGYCVEFLPVMKQAQTDYGFTTVYYDITQALDFTNGGIADQDAYDYITGLDDFFQEFGSTPMVAVFKEGKYVNGTVGYTDYDTYAKFLEDSGIVKK